MLLWGHIEVFRGNTVSDTHRLHDQYGDVVRITPNALSFRTAQAAKGRGRYRSQ